MCAGTGIHTKEAFDNSSLHSCGFYLVLVASWSWNKLVPVLTLCIIIITPPTASISIEEATQPETKYFIGVTLHARGKDLATILYSLSTVVFPQVQCGMWGYCVRFYMGIPSLVLLWEGKRRPGKHCLHMHAILTIFRLILLIPVFLRYTIMCDDVMARSTDKDGQELYVILRSLNVSYAFRRFHL